MVKLKDVPLAGVTVMLWPDVAPLVKIVPSPIAGIVTLCAPSNVAAARSTSQLAEVVRKAPLLGQDTLNDSVGLNGAAMIEKPAIAPLALHVWVTVVPAAVAWSLALQS
jgi:hypothetical protein